jgi:hypothetical protein
MLTALDRLSDDVTPGVARRGVRGTAQETPLVSRLGGWNGACVSSQEADVASVQPRRGVLQAPAGSFASHGEPTSARLKPSRVRSVAEPSVQTLRTSETSWTSTRRLMR